MKALQLKWQKKAKAKKMKFKNASITFLFYSKWNGLKTLFLNTRVSINRHQLQQHVGVIKGIFVIVDGADSGKDFLEYTGGTSDAQIFQFLDILQSYCKN